MQTLQCRFCEAFKKLDQEAPHPTLSRRFKTAYSRTTNYVSGRTHSISWAATRDVGRELGTMVTLIALAHLDSMTHKAQWRFRETEFATCLTGRSCQDELDWDGSGPPPLSNLLQNGMAWR